MKFKQKLELAREESFDLENPDISLISITSDVRIIESLDGKTHIKIFADSKKAAELSDQVEITESKGKLTIRFDKKNWSWNTSLPLDINKQNFWGLNFGGLHGLSFEIALPKSADLKVKTVSGDIEVLQTLANIEIGSVSGDVTINQNPSGNCTVKTVSGNITSQTFSGCEYTLKSISGDIEVSVAPDLDVEVDGNSISGDLNSEISLDGDNDSSTSSSKVVRITTSTISGNFNLARN